MKFQPQVFIRQLTPVRLIYICIWCGKSHKKNQNQVECAETNERGNMPGVSDAGEKDNEPPRD